MKRLAWMVVAVLIVAAASSAAFAQQDPGGGPGPLMQRGENREVTPEQFKDFKARALKMIEDRKARLEQEKTCVDAATNMEELRKCRPERPMGPGGGFRGGPQEGQERQMR